MTPVTSRLQHQQRRTAASGSSGGGKSPADPASTEQPGPRNKILEEYHRNNPQGLSKGAAAAAAAARQQMPDAGDIATSSIFEDDRRSQQQATEDERKRKREAEEEDRMFKGRNPENMQYVLDPRPKARQRWERKKVIQAVRKGGRITQEQLIKRTEREHLAKSINLKTSVKKLGMLARQIAGKTLDDAIVQMLFSKKKAAIAVKNHLQAARDEAVVVRGMGLGAVVPEDDRDQEPKPNPEPLDIQLKDGKRYTVTEPSKIYVDQAWVGRGPYGKLADYRARGKVNLMRTPFTSLSVVLKEETTRVREWREREEKRRRKRLQQLWVQLPDRPVQGPRGQYYSW